MRKQKEKKISHTHTYIYKETKWKREKRNITLISCRIENRREREGERELTCSA